MLTIVRYWMNIDIEKEVDNMKVVFSSITRDELTDMAIWLKCGFLEYLKDEEVDNCKWIIKWASICDTLENAKYEKNGEIIL